MPSGHWPTVLAVLVHWNRPQETVQCIQSLRESAACSVEVVVVDNASRTEERQALKQELPDIRVVQTEQNLGYAGGFNLGARVALPDTRPDYVWLLNNDTTVASDCASALIVAAQNAGAGIFTPKILLKDDPARLWYAGGYLDHRLKSHHIGRGHQDAASYDQPSIVPWGSGCSLFMATRDLERAGPMCEEYFLYLEDVDWCLQASRRGIPTYYVPSARVYHGVSKSVDLLDPRAVVYYGWRNYYMLARRQGRPWQQALALSDLCSRLVKTVVKLSLDPGARRDPFYLARTRALLDFVRGRTGPAPFGDRPRSGSTEALVAISS